MTNLYPRNLYRISQEEEKVNKEFLKYIYLFIKEMDIVYSLHYGIQPNSIDLSRVNELCFEHC
jgi:hypothetical protein